MREAVKAERKERRKKNVREMRGREMRETGVVGEASEKENWNKVGSGRESEGSKESKGNKHEKAKSVVGIDLAASPRRITGICVYDGSFSFRSVHTDDEILSVVLRNNPCVVAIDAPLSFTGTHFRDCDLAVMRICPVLPLTFKGMQRLAERGIHISSRIKEMTKQKCEVIEVYPRASERVLASHHHILKSYPRILIQNCEVKVKNKHEYDAFLCALTAKFYIEGKFKEMGEKSKIIIPLPNTTTTKRASEHVNKR